MSTRWYPLYRQGAPQLRVFLPNFWMKLVRAKHEQPPNVVQFSCSMEMTRYDIKNYLEKIYKVNVVDVRTRIALGETKKDPGRGYIVKKDDIKYAYVVLPKDEKFVFPDLFENSIEAKEKEERDKSLEEMKKTHQKFLDKNKTRPHTPGWFSI